MADLITIETYKQAKAITSAKEDERLSVLVPAISQLVKTYCGHSLIDYVDTDYTEYFNIIWDTDTIQAGQSPIITITELWQRPSATDSYVQLTEGTDFVVSTRDDTIIRLNSNWYKGYNSVKMLYRAGYATLPEDLNLALIDLIHYYMHSEYKTSKTMSGSTINNSPSSSMYKSNGFPDHIKRILDLYRYA